jgi:hypothetical protein
MNSISVTTDCPTSFIRGESILDEVTSKNGAKDTNIRLLPNYSVGYAYRERRLLSRSLLPKQKIYWRSGMLLVLDNFRGVEITGN